MGESLLALDVGNGSIKVGRFAEGRCTERARLALDADLDRLPAASAHAAVSVNPSALLRVRAAFPGLRVVGEEIPVPLPVEYDPPGACGLDRVMGVLGALYLHPEARTVLVLDSGTCLTATLGVRGRGVVGGAILPGAELMARALASGTAALPYVDPTPAEAGPGRSTAASIRLGIQAALAGAARELIRRLRPGLPEPFVALAAGTGAASLRDAVPEIDHARPELTLWGILVSARPAPPQGRLT